MRTIVLLLALTLATTASAAASAPAADRSVGIVRVLHGWRETASFKHIGEYFDGREHTGGEVVLRTHADQRAGYYFLVRLANPGAERTVRIHLLVIDPESATPHEFNFPAGLPGRETIFNLGLTGADWAGAKINPVAWKLEILDPAGRLLATEQSYLWEKPAGS